MRVWDDDPPEDRVAASGLSAGGDSAYTYDAVSGASIAQTDLVDDASHFVPGMIVSNATSTYTDAMGSTSPMVRRSSGSYDDDAFGVVALSPNLRFGQNTGAVNFVNVALTGRTVVFVSLENGPIHQGDRITASSIEGVGMKAVRPGTVVGVAISGFATSSCDVSFTKELTDADVSVPANACIGQVVVQLKAGQDLGIGSILQTATTTPFENLTSALSELANTAFNKGAQFLKMVVGELVAKVAVIGNLFADTITVNNLTVGSQSQPAGITLFDQVTHAPYCFSIQNGQSVTTPGTCDHPTGPSQTSTAPSSSTSSTSSNSSTSTPDTSVSTSTSDTTISTPAPDSTVSTSDASVTISTPDATPPPADTAPAADTTVAPVQ
jgi:hypothetical protein